MTNNETQPSPAMSAISAMADSAPSTISQQSSTNVAPGEASVPASPATETLKHRNTEAPSPAPSSPLAASTFPLRPGETPRAFNAFRAWFELGQTRTLQAVADSLGESPGTIRNWSSKYNWNGRLQDYQSGLLDAAARQQTASHLEQVADWNRRLAEFREQEWEAAQRLIAAARCFLESFGEEDVQRMNLSQVSRALRISSTIARSALVGAELPPTPDAGLSPLQHQLLASLARLYGQASPPPLQPTPLSTLNHQPSPRSTDH